MVTPQELPEHSPDQPVSSNGPVELGVNPTFSPGLNGLVHVATQLGGLPLGHAVVLPHTIEVIAPAAATSNALPSKVSPSVSMWILTLSGGLSVKLAPALCGVAAVTAQAPVPEQAPDQPENTESRAGAANSDIDVFAGTVSVHGRFGPPDSEPARTPSQPPAIPPLPVPELDAATATPGAQLTNVDIALRGPPIAMRHDDDEPVHAPPQPPKCHPEAALAVSCATESCWQLGAPPGQVADTLLGDVMTRSSPLRISVTSALRPAEVGGESGTDT